MRKFIAYYGLVVRTAFRHSLDHTQTVLFVLFVLAGAATSLVRWFSPKAAAMIPDVSNWEIAAGVLGAIVLARLMLAPYWIWQEQDREIKSLKDSPIGSTSAEELALRNREIAAQERHAAAIEAQIKQREDENDPRQMEIRKQNEFWAARLAGIPLERPHSPAVLDRPARPPQIEIRFEKRAPYEVSEIQHHHVLSTVRIGICNSGGSPLSNCRVLLEKMAPELPIMGSFPILMVSDRFTLRPDDPEKLIDIATHFDHVDKFRFNGPVSTFAESLNYLDDKQPLTIVLRVEAVECQRSASFRFWTDANRAVHLEMIGYVS